MTRVYGAAPGGGAFAPERFFVTIGGMHAIEIATRMIVGPGDEALIPSPAWPNFVGAIEISGARAVPVPLERGETRWRLDPDRLAAAVTPATRAHLRQFARQPDRLRRHPRGNRRDARRSPAATNLWIVADEIYGRLTYDGARAPSFHDVMAPDDKILFVQTLSKNWAMTGWRIGWLEAPPALGAGDREPRPVHDLRRAGVQPARRDRGARRGRGVPRRPDRALPRARATSSATGWRRPAACASPGRRRRSTCSAPSTAKPIHARWRCGWSTRRASASRPASAFGPGGEGYLRLCFGRAPDEIAEATRRLARWLKR